VDYSLVVAISSEVGCGTDTTGSGGRLALVEPVQERLGTYHQNTKVRQTPAVTLHNWSSFKNEAGFIPLGHEVGRSIPEFTAN